MTSLRTQGFSPVEAILILIGVAVITTLGLVFYKHFVNPDTQTASTTSATSLTAPVTSIKTTADLDKASTALDGLDINDTKDTATITSQAAGF